MWYIIPMTTSTRKRGRPALRLDAPLDKHVNMRLGSDELAQIKTAAEEHGLSVSQYLRAATVGTATLDPQTRDIVLTAGSAIPNPDQTQLDLMPD
jgi:hypothetical protein